MTPLLVLVVTLAAAGAFGLLWTRRTGRLREPPAAADDSASPADDLAEWGVRLGDRATLLQFSSTFCAPCRATRRILGEVAAMVDGVTHAEVDAESHLAAVRRLRIMRTPTTLVLDRRGRVVVRASGQPRKADVVAAIARVVDAG